MGNRLRYAEGNRFHQMYALSGSRRGSNMFLLADTCTATDCNSAEQASQERVPSHSRAFGYLVSALQPHASRMQQRLFFRKVMRTVPQTLQNPKDFNRVGC